MRRERFSSSRSLKQRPKSFGVPSQKQIPDMPEYLHVPVPERLPESLFRTRRMPVGKEHHIQWFSIRECKVFRIQGWFSHGNPSVIPHCFLFWLPLSICHQSIVKSVTCVSNRGSLHIFLNLWIKHCTISAVSDSETTHTLPICYEFSIAFGDPHKWNKAK